MSNQKKICFLADALIIGGVENVLISAVKILHTEYDITIICTKDDPLPFVTQQLPDDVHLVTRRIKHKGFSLLFPFGSGKFFEQALGNEEFDFVITIRYDGLFSCFCKKGKNKIYWCFNDYDLKYLKFQKPLGLKKRLRRFCRRYLYKHQKMVWTVNSAVADGLSQALSLNNVKALPNPIDCDEIIKKSKVPCDVTFDKNKINLVFLGRISREKGVIRILKMIASNAFENSNDYHFYFIGGGDSLEHLKSKIKEIGFEHRITFLGSQSNPYPYLKQADLLICPSIYESFGLVMIEAMLFYIPVITTATVGGKYVTQDNMLACCVENDDVALQEAILKFIEDPSSYNYPLEDAKQWALKHDISEFGKTLHQLLRQCDET